MEINYSSLSYEEQMAIANLHAPENSDPLQALLDMEDEDTRRLLEILDIEELEQAAHFVQVQEKKRRMKNLAHRAAIRAARL